nr:microfibrillar-associated protein 1-like [Ipomoea batatas]
MSVTAGVSDTVIAIREKLRGKIGQTKVKRYWPGKAPEWADEAEEDGDIRTTRAAALETAFPSQDGSDVGKRDDPRLRRLAESRIDNREEVRADHRRIRQAEIVSTIEEENRRLERVDEEDEDEDALDEKRRRIREKDTIAERERLEAEEQALEDLMKKRLEERKVETKQLIVEKIREEEEIQKNLDTEANIADVDTDDEKYYHKGAFFQSNPDDRAGTAGGDNIFSRDFSAPTGEDKLDKTILPKVMQVKHFGRSGRTKWTHLVNEDTTDWNNP